MPGGILWSTPDPRAIQVELKQATWDLHVLVQPGRAFLSGQQDRVRTVVEHPSVIFEDPRVADRESYLALGMFVLPGRGLAPMALQIVVDVVRADARDVVTIFPVRKVSSVPMGPILYER